MKLNFKVFFLFFFVSFPISADDFKATYVVEVGKLDIGKLFWNLEISDKEYQIIIKLKDKGFLSGIYKFKGSYEATGLIDDNIITPNYYKQFWQTKNKNRSIEIKFNNRKLVKLNMLPKETELPRINFINIENHMDPLSSFVNLLMGAHKSKTIDGRRVYSMVLVENKINKEIQTKKISIENYINIWTDHKRNDLEYLEIVSDLNNNLLPLQFNIKFKRLLFKLTKI